jgi:hypothetical protein
MREASLMKFFLVKYFFLLLGLLQLLIVGILLTREAVHIKSQFAILMLAALGLIFVTIYLTITSKVKRVAIGKKKIAIISSQKVKRYNIDDVKYIRTIPAFNIAYLKLKGRKQRVYFIPHGDTRALYGLISTNPAAILRRDK